MPVKNNAYNYRKYHQKTYLWQTASTSRISSAHTVTVNFKEGGGLTGKEAYRITVVAATAESINLSVG